METYGGMTLGGEQAKVDCFSVFAFTFKGREAAIPAASDLKGIVYSQGNQEAMIKMYTASSNTSCRAAFKAFNGVEDSLAQGFFGLSRVGLHRYYYKKTQTKYAEIPWDKDVFFIRVTNGTLLATACFDRGRSGGRSNIITMGDKIS